jgi:hypothetical protein
MGAGWFLHSVTIAADNKATLDFPCNRWLDKSEDDKQIVRDLVPGPLPQSATPKTSTKPAETKPPTTPTTAATPSAVAPPTTAATPATPAAKVLDSDKKEIKVGGKVLYGGQHQGTVRFVGETKFAPGIVLCNIFILTSL